MSNQDYFLMFLAMIMGRLIWDLIKWKFNWKFDGK